LPGAKVDSYPTHEEHGFIWAFLGDEPEAAPPIIDMPEIDQPGYRWVPHGEIWNANYHYCTFADIDLVHVPIVHAMAFNDDFTPVEEIRRPDEYTVESICRPAPDRPVGNWKDVREVGQNIESTLTFQISGFMLKGAVEMGGKGSGTFLTFYSASTPIDHETTYMRYLFGRNWLTDPKHDEETVNRNLKNVREDRAMAEGQMPKSGPLPPSGNDLVIEPEDYLMKGYWEIVERHSAKGWQIDTAALDQLNRPGERYHVIPSPGRKADPKNWVHPTVPTIDPSSFTKAAAE
jgi:phenylpropionate dioxygenase-like ring-hydroxylating dioxygenase large terminal subunit